MSPNTIGGYCSRPVYLKKNVKLVSISQGTPFATVLLDGKNMRVFHSLKHPEVFTVGDVVDVWTDTETNEPMALRRDTDRVGRTRGNRTMIGLHRCKSERQTDTILKWICGLCTLGLLWMTIVGIVSPLVSILVACGMLMVLCAFRKHIVSYFATHVFDETIVSIED